MYRGSLQFTCQYELRMPKVHTVYRDPRYHRTENTKIIGVSFCQVSVLGGTGTTRILKITYGIKKPKLEWEHNTICQLYVLLELFLVFETFQMQR